MDQLVYLILQALFKFIIAIAEGRYGCVLAASFGVGGSYSAVVLKSV